MKRGLTVLIALLLLACAGSAGAQEISSLGITFGNVPANAKHVIDRDVALGVSGVITVSFHADATSDCARLANCAYHGTLIWNPGGGGGVIESSYTVRGRRHTDRALIFGPTNSPISAVTYADVTRDAGAGAPKECVDEQPSGLGADGRRTGSGYIFSLSQLITPTRCAGPLPSDLRSALPAILLPAVLHPGLHITANGTKAFAAHGFAGTVTSSLLITVGATQTQPLITPGERLRSHRFRLVTVPIVGVRAAGALTARVNGSTNTAVCVLLDSCGVVGTLTVAPAPGVPHGFLTAQAPVSRPLRDVLTALGLATGGRAQGIGVLGTVSWPERGTVTAALDQSSDCRDTAPLDTGTAILVADGGRTSAEYVPGGLEAPGPRTRCPGPMLWQAGGITGSFAQRILGHRTFSIDFSPHSAATDDGYDAQNSGHIRLTFRRGKPSVRIESQPTF